MNKPRWKVWLQAARLRTLPLACAAVLLGSGLAAGADLFHANVFVLCLLTAIGLQILSNLANDYGDAVSGADNEDRVGPQRTVVSGLITREQMQRAMRDIAVRGDIIYPAHDPLVLEEDKEKRLEALRAIKPWP